MANDLPEADQRSNLPDYNWIAALPDGERVWIAQAGGTLRSFFLPTGLLDFLPLAAHPSISPPAGRARIYFVGSVLFVDDGSGPVAIAPAQSMQMAIGGALDAPPLPLTGAGAEVATTAMTLASLQARRGVPETSGTTTIQLEVNGVPVAGATLSWTVADAAFALKSVALSQVVAKGDRVSLRLTSAGAGAEDVYAEASA